MKYLSLLFLFVFACKGVEKTVETFPSGTPKLKVLVSEEGTKLAETGFYINNIRKYRVELKDGLREGVYEEWNTKGQKTWDGFYRAGKKSGTWESWYNKTQIEEAGEYVEGQKEGQWLRYWPNGVVQKESYFKSGKLVGVEKEYSKEGALLVENSCAEKGLYQEWNQGGVLRLKYECENGKKVGAWQRFDDEGTLMERRQYQKDSLDGERTFYHKEGWVRRIESYAMGRREGRQLHLRAEKDTLLNAFLEGGTGWLLYGNRKDQFPDTPFVAGKVEGKIEKIEKGRKTISHYVKGTLVFMEYFGLGAKNQSFPISAGGFQKGKKHGPWKIYQSQGRMLKEKLHYKEGELFGLQQYFDSTGTLYMEKKYSGKNQPVFVEILSEQKKK